jgi:CRP-like cAMP-binding protein
MTVKAIYLSQVDALRDLTGGDIADIEQHTRLVHYPQGHLFYMPDDPGEVLFILKQGQVQLYKISSDGRKLVLAVMRPGDIFGQMALVGQHMHSTYAESLDAVTICVWRRDEVEAYLKRKPEVALRFLDALGERLRQSEERLTEVTFKRLPARLASLLLRLDDHGDGLLLGVTHQYLADSLGTYRETVTQLLNEFKHHGWMSLGRKKIQILNRSAMIDLARN